MNQTRANYSKTKALLFDLDGTLLDSFPVHLKIFQATMARFNIQVDEKTFIDTYTPDWYQSYRKLGLPPEHWPAANACWLDEAQKHKPALLPGVATTLNALLPTYRMGIVTSGSCSRVLRDINEHNLAHFFETVITGDDIQQPKPHPQGLELALAAMDIRPDQGIYIGDTLSDWEMACAAEVPFLGIPSQFASLTPQIPCPQVARFSDLLAIFTRPPTSF